MWLLCVAKSKLINPDEESHNSYSVSLTQIEELTDFHSKTDLSSLHSFLLPTCKKVQKRDFDYGSNINLPSSLRDMWRRGRGKRTEA